MWYEVVVTDNASLSAPQGGNWVKVSDEVFLLEDETGQCVIDPERAEIHSARERRWAIDGSRYRARYLMVGDLVHVMGELSTQRAHDGSDDRRAHVAELLRTWKRDPKAMLRRFDDNDDGEIDMDEYRRAVREAEREPARGALIRCRQKHLAGAAASELTVHPDRPPMTADDPQHRGQTQPAPGELSGEEWIEQLRLGLLVHPTSGICDLEIHVAPGWQCLPGVRTTLKTARPGCSQRNLPGTWGPGR